MAVLTPKLGITLLWNIQLDKIHCKSYLLRTLSWIPQTCILGHLFFFFLTVVYWKSNNIFCLLSITKSRDQEQYQEKYLIYCWIPTTGHKCSVPNRKSGYQILLQKQRVRSLVISALQSKVRGSSPATTLRFWFESGCYQRWVLCSNRLDNI